MTEEQETQTQQEIILKLQQEVVSLRDEKKQLEAILELTSSHSDTMLEELQQQTSQLQEKCSELELLLSLTCEHSDAIEGQLHDQFNQEIYQNQQRLQAFFEAIPVGIYVSNAQGEPYYLNATGRTLLGYRNSSLSAAEIIPNIKIHLESSDQPYPEERFPISLALTGIESMKLLIIGHQIGLIKPDTIFSPNQCHFDQFIVHIGTIFHGIFQKLVGNITYGGLNLLWIGIDLRSGGKSCHVICHEVGRKSIVAPSLFKRSWRKKKKRSPGILLSWVSPQMYQ